MFYVYHLIDPRSGQVFYVGKGTSGRIGHHEKEAAKGAYNRKCDTIRAIWSDGMSVEKRIVSRHNDENDAFSAESREIDRIGLDRLTNVLPGGLIGREVYLSRKAERERKAAKDTQNLYMAQLPSIAPKIAKFYRERDRTGGFGMVLNGEWLDCSHAVNAFIQGIVTHVGMDAFSREMSKHGVVVTTSGGDHG